MKFSHMVSRNITYVILELDLPSSNYGILKLAWVSQISIVKLFSSTSIKKRGSTTLYKERKPFLVPSLFPFLVFCALVSGSKFQLVSHNRNSVNTSIARIPCNKDGKCDVVICNAMVMIMVMSDTSWETLGMGWVGHVRWWDKSKPNINIYIYNLAFNFLKSLLIMHLVPNVTLWWFKWSLKPRV